MRPRDTLTPQQERELEALDRALLGEPVDVELRELEQLVHAIAATAPEMSPAFAARLEHEVGEGFPEPREQPSRVRMPRRRWILLPAVGSLAAVLIALVVVLGGDGSGSPGRSAEDLASAPRQSVQESAGGADDDAASTAAAPAPAASAGRAAPVAPVAPVAPGPSVDVKPSARKVERSATLALETPAGDFDPTVAAVQARVASFGGIVASAQTGESDAAGGEATFDLRIPTDRLDRALAALAKLGHVTERSQSMQDITGSFASAQERLSDARAERRGLLRALARASSQAQIAGLKAQLRGVGSRIGALEGELSSLRRRADLATVLLTVRGTGESGATGAGQWTPGDAAGDALRVLEVVAGVALVGLAALVPAALLGMAIALAVRLARRRRREAALDRA